MYENINEKKTKSNAANFKHFTHLRKRKAKIKEKCFVEREKIV